MTTYSRIGLFYNPDYPKAIQALSKIKTNQFIDLIKNPNENVNLIVVLGGDGTMLRCIRNYLHQKIPFYGVKHGKIGFLMNDPSHNLHKSIENSYTLKLPTIECQITKINKDNSTESITYHAINDINLFRSTGQAVFINVNINGISKIEQLICDGVVVSSPTGSTGYNHSLGGSIIPIGSNLICMMAAAPMEPKFWHGAILPNTDIITLQSLQPATRPCHCAIDGLVIENVTQVKAYINQSIQAQILLHNKDQLLNRSMDVQFHS